MPALALRIGFVGELGYELHVREPVRRIRLGRARRRGRAGRSASRRSGSCAWRSSTSSSARTPTRSRTLFDAGMPWIVKLDKDDFVGARGARARSGSRLPRAAGRIRAAGWSRAARGRTDHRRRRVRAGASPVPAGARRLGRAIGLAWVASELAEEGTEIKIRVAGQLEAADVRLRPFYDPEGERLRS